VSDFTPAEQRNVRTAIRFLRLSAGRWEATALHVANDTIEKVINGRRPVTPALAFRVARLANVALEDVLDGTYPSKRCCRHCGHVVEEADDVGDVGGDGGVRRSELKLARAEALDIDAGSRR
jgi:hypothetical protein